MDQQQALLAQQVKKQEKSLEKQMNRSQQCSNCGTSFACEDKFCEECGMYLRNVSCSHCGNPIQSNWEICTHCGHGLCAELCSFCGSEMGAEDAFCPDCGNPRIGITCADCGSLNFRSFCRKCNRPLNEMAKLEMEKAQRDPLFKEMLVLAQELADLEDQLLGDFSEKVAIDDNTNQQWIQQYKDLLASVRSAQPNLSLEMPSKTAIVRSRSKVRLNVLQENLEETKEAYQAKLKEMQALMAKLCPESDATPQMQRNYYSARKLPILRKTVEKSPVYWICNLCSCQHKQPGDCAQPELGGTWVYEDIVTVTRVFDYEDE